jgi:hypothetical protein
MKPSVRIDYDETGSGKFKVTVGYHEGDTATLMGQTADVIVYVDATGRTLPDSVPEISDAAVAEARRFLQRIVDGKEGREH